MNIRLGALLLVVTTAFSTACGGGGAEAWGGTIVDSAGVTVVRNPADGNWTTRAAPRIVEELRIGSEDGAPELQFAQIAALDVDENGTIYVLDAQAAQVRVFDADGRYIRSIGRPGGGPGELSNVTVAVLAAGDGGVYVADIMRQRIVELATDGTELGSTPIRIQQGIPLRWEVTPERRLAVQIRSMALPGMDTIVAPRDRIIVRDPAGAAPDTLFEMESGMTVQFTGGGPRMRLFEAEPIWTLLGGGRAARARNDSYRIELVDRAGEVERVITKPAERQPVSEGERDAFRTLMRDLMQRQGVPPAQLQQFLQNVEFADHYPVFAAMFGGPDDALWVQRIHTASEAQREGAVFDPQNLGSATWDVFDADGRLLGSVRMPPRFQPLRVVGDRIFGVLRDELDVQYVARLRLDGW